MKLALIKVIVFVLLCSFVLTSCSKISTDIHPCVVSPPHPKQVFKEKRIAINLPQGFSTYPFPCLTSEECCQDWGKELGIGLAFADDFDLYRAITSFKRALFLLPCEAKERRLQIEYLIALAYYLGCKYVEAVYAVESTELLCVDPSFPAFSDLLLLLYDSYTQLGREAQAEHILQLIDQFQPQIAGQLRVLEMLEMGDLDGLYAEGETNPCRTYLQDIVCSYESKSKSPKAAQLLNALLPGAGYWYVGQKQTAVTALLINSLFIAAAAHFIDHRNTAAAIITLSLESGWYLGGITGAGLAARTYNEHLYQCYADKITQKEQLFPLVMLKYSF